MKDLFLRTTHNTALTGAGGRSQKRLRVIRRNLLQILLHAACWVPAVLLVSDYLTGNLTANPIQAATQRTGRTALILLIFSLVPTPLATYFRFTQAVRFRRPLGLYAFAYAGLHFVIFIWIDMGLIWAFILDGFIQKPYALVGFSAFLSLIPLAITSTRGWQRRLGRGWKRLHRLVYAAALLVVLHYAWVVKSDIREPVLWGIALSFLLLVRTRPVKARIRSLIPRLNARWRNSA